MTENLLTISNDVAVSLFTGMLVLGLLFGFILYFLFSYRRKQKDYRLLQTQKEEIDNQKLVVEQTLAELRATQSQLIHRERMASLGELITGIAHEIQNPLNFVNNFSEVNRDMITELKKS
jgi:two-component system NtrC family sensor kinase